MKPDIPLTPRAHKLLAALVKRGGWVSRAELAHALGRQRLSLRDTGIIENMVNKGLIEIHVFPVSHREMAVEYKAI